MPETYEAWLKRRGFDPVLPTLTKETRGWIAQGLSADEIMRRRNEKLDQDKEQRRMWAEEVSAFPEPLESLYWMREVIVRQLDALKQPFDYPPLQTGIVGLHIYTPEDPVLRLSPELDEQMRKQREADLIGIDARIARAEKEWSETPKLTLKRPLKLAGSGLVLPAGSEFVRTDEMFRYPGQPEFRILMTRGTPYHATDAAIDEALKD